MGLSHLVTIIIAISRTNNQPNFSDVESMWDAHFLFGSGDGHNMGQNTGVHFTMHTQ